MVGIIIKKIYCYKIYGERGIVKLNVEENWQGKQNLLGIFELRMKPVILYTTKFTAIANG
jgi:hypothetical protein